MKAHKLSNLQERELLKQLLTHKPIDNGSSRLVYIHPTDRTKVVKVAVGANAFRQNKTEVEMWNEHGDDGFLAQIYDYGVFVIVMERMKYCYTDEADFDYDHPFWETSNKVGRILGGYSADNYQIGQSIVDDGWKCYDYGFVPELGSSYQVGWAGSIDSAQKFVKMARQMLIDKVPVTRIERYYAKLAY